MNDSQFVRDLLDWSLTLTPSRHEDTMASASTQILDGSPFNDSFVSKFKLIINSESADSLNAKMQYSKIAIKPSKLLNGDSEFILIPHQGKSYVWKS